MPGVRLMGGIGAFAGPGTQQPASTVTEAAFGPGYSDGAPSAGASLAPTNPVPLAFWGGVGAFGFLVFLRHSLPAERRRDFDMVLMMLLAWEPAKGLARLSVQRLAQEPQTTPGGAIDTVARALIWILR